METLNHLDSLHLRDREIDGILNDPPGWFVRVGSFIMLGLVVLIIGVCLLIKYPDSVETSIDLTAHSVTQHINIPYSKTAADIITGTEVSIELDNRPKQKYGLLKGTVKNIDYSAELGQYNITIEIVPLQKDAHGVAIVQASSKNLLQRLYETLRPKAD